ncbi:hypothetical protein BC938DRAFT_472317 [Jimgerdemannia flammicorona]|uniref:Uncharacterized protein n=1 Tax=Jimgerdemannia flammicorona TaxID=994334 RepID=A0A433Q6D3_9FUNG|nr:hypothetical protein BC938DRAFT_472317 [Jimgerdemannia flammicorona]
MISIGKQRKLGAARKLHRVPSNPHTHFLTCKEVKATLTKRDHTNCLPHSKPDPRHDAPIEPLDTILGVNPLGRCGDGELLGPSDGLDLGLHLNANDFDGLIPAGQRAGGGRRQNLVERGLALGGVDVIATRQTEAGGPVRALTYRHGVHALVDTTDALAAVDVRGDFPGRGLDG